MSDLRDLYQEVILDHNRCPRNYGPLDEANGRAEGHNPLCGDHVKVFVRTADGRIAAITFEGNGCAISRASASLMTEAVKGLSLAEVNDLSGRFQSMVKTPIDVDIDETGLGKLTVLGGVRAFPVRIKCASLAWHALNAALSGTADSVTIT